MAKHFSGLDLNFLDEEEEAEGRAGGGLVGDEANQGGGSASLVEKELADGFELVLAPAEVSVFPLVEATPV